MTWSSASIRLTSRPAWRRFFRHLEADEAAADDGRALDALLTHERTDTVPCPARSRGVCTREDSMPGIGGLSGEEPVAITSTS